MVSFQRGSTEGGREGRGGAEQESFPAGKTETKLTIINLNNWWNKSFCSTLKKTCALLADFVFTFHYNSRQWNQNSTYRKLKFANTFNTFSQSVYTVITKQFFLSFSIKTPLWLIELAKNHLQHGEAWYFKAVGWRRETNPANQNKGRLCNEPVRAWTAKRAGNASEQVTCFTFDWFTR